jgi:epoxyqueuosine reductase
MCGSCTACLDACPTRAFPAPSLLDATRCRYLTIELKGGSPSRCARVGRHVFGTATSAGTWPLNRKRRHRGEPAFEPRPGALHPDFADLAGLEPEAFGVRFQKSPLKRAKRRGLLRNVAVAIGNAGAAEHRPLLERLASDLDPLVAEHARWGLARLDARLSARAGSS